MNLRVMELAKRAKDIIEETDMFVSGINEGKPSTVKVHIKNDGEVLALEGAFSEEEIMCFDDIDEDILLEYHLVDITFYYLADIECYKQRELEGEDEGDGEEYDLEASNWCDNRRIGDIHHENYVKVHYDNRRVKNKILKAYEELMEIQKEAREILLDKK